MIKVLTVLNLCDPLLKDCTNILFSALQKEGEKISDENFNSEGRPPWKPLSPRRVAQRNKMKPPRGEHPILQITGRLKDSVVAEKEGLNTCSIGTNVPYANDHQFGIPAKRLPARPFMPWEEADCDKIANAFFEDFVKELTK